MDHTCGGPRAEGGYAGGRPHRRLVQHQGDGGDITTRALCALASPALRRERISHRRHLHARRA